MEDLTMTLVKFTNRYPSFFDRFFDSELFDWTSRNYSETNTTIPSVNIKESDNDFEVEMAAPGFTKNDFRVELNHDILTVSSEKKVENETREGQEFTKREFSYQSFCRSFTLPHTVDNQKISASYDNGILKVLIPKKEEAKTRPPRTIEIS